jgi:hypothetical protein
MLTQRMQAADLAITHDGAAQYLTPPQSLAAPDQHGHARPEEPQ